VDEKRALLKESSIFRFLYNTYKEYFFILFFQLLTWDFEEKIISSFEIIDNKLTKDKKESTKGNI